MEILDESQNAPNGKCDGANIKTFPFMTLPEELRNMIYRAIFPAQIHFEVKIPTRNDPPKCYLIKQDAKSLHVYRAAVLVNKQLRTELMKQFIHECTFALRLDFEYEWEKAGRVATPLPLGQIMLGGKVEFLAQVRRFAFTETISYKSQSVGRTHPLGAFPPGRSVSRITAHLVMSGRSWSVATRWSSPVGSEYPDMKRDTNEIREKKADEIELLLNECVEVGFIVPRDLGRLMRAIRVNPCETSLSNWDIKKLRWTSGSKWTG